METDNFLKIGSSHKVCEDYTLVGDNYIIISDGCSSAKMTDVGARILTISAATVIKRYIEQRFIPTYEVFGDIVLHTALAHSRALNLPDSSLYATLLIAFHIDGYTHVYVYGDGHVVSESNDGKKCHISYEYGRPNKPELNAPYYLAYWMDPKQYTDQFGKDNLQVYENGSEVVPFNSHVYDDTKTLTLFTDGIESFRCCDECDLKALYVAHELTSYKNYKGEFVQRRCKAAMKYFKRLDPAVTHTDDIAVASMYLGE